MSFNEAADKGQCILDEMVESNRAVTYHSWHDVAAKLGDEIDKAWLHYQTEARRL